MEFKDYYAILGLERTATPEEIKKAYRKQVRKYHPDVSKEKNAEEKTKEINEAYEVLSDKSKRAKYDQLGANWREGQEFKPPPDWQGQRGTTYYTSDFGDIGAGNFSDFFESLFGGGFGTQQRQQSPFHQYSRTRKNPAQRGDDLHMKIAVSLQDAFNGVTHTFTIPLTTVDNNGRTHTQNKTLKVKIPAGVTAGQQIRLAGQGNPGVNGGPAGDLFLEVEFSDHPFFTAEGADIYLTLPITPWEAALGATVPVPTLSTKVELKIPGGSQSGQKLRLKNRGLPATPPGDQYVILQIVTPPADTPAAKEIYQKMASTFQFNPRANLGV